ncbi:MAG: amidohydrolase family protein [Flavobacteriaceae bacterium]|nr:amidohydrolase family protein [Flavobacteriaceae bacterium]
MLSVLWTTGEPRGLSLEKLLTLLTENPAKFLGLEQQKGRLREGFDADISVFDEHIKFTVSEGIIEHKHKASPYIGEILKGKIIHTFVNGVQVVKDSELIELNAGTLLLKT